MTKLALSAGCLTVLLLLPCAALAADPPSAETSPPVEAAPPAADAAAQQKALEEAAAKNKAAEAEAAKKKAAEDEAAQKKAAEEEAAKKKADDDDGSKFIIALDGHLIGPIEDGEEEIGSGLEARIGWHKTHLFGLLFVRPELGGGFNRLLANNTGRFYGGARLGLQFIVSAYLYGHGGYGWGAPDGGFTYDVGVGADLVLLSFIRPGVHFDYMKIADLQMVRGGIHLEFAF